MYFFKRLFGQSLGHPSLRPEFAPQGKRGICASRTPTWTPTWEYFICTFICKFGPQRSWDQRWRGSLLGLFRGGGCPTCSAFPESSSQGTKQKVCLGSLHCQTELLFPDLPEPSNEVPKICKIWPEWHPQSPVMGSPIGSARTVAGLSFCADIPIMGLLLAPGEPPLTSTLQFSVAF